MDSNTDLLQWCTTFCANTSAACAYKFASGAIKSEIMQNQESAEELSKPITRTFEKPKVHSSFIDNIWGADLVDMQSTSKFNKEICFLLCVMDIFSKYAWVVPLKCKKGITIANSFQKIICESNSKPNKIRAVKGSGSYNRSMISLLHDNDTEIYSTHNAAKSVVAERFIRTLKNKKCVY